MTRMPARSRGFSLVELMITIAIIAILMVIAVPSFRDTIHRNQVSSASNALLGSLAYARAEAINRGQLVSMCPGSKAAGCTAAATAYEPGWIVYTYPAGAASANKAYAAASSILLRATGAQAGVSIQALGTTVVTFGQQGELKPSTQLKFVTCYRSGSSGTGTITSTVPGAELDVLGSGSVQMRTATACTPS